MQKLSIYQIQSQFSNSQKLFKNSILDQKKQQNFGILYLLDHKSDQKQKQNYDSILSISDIESNHKNYGTDNKINENCMSNNNIGRHDDNQFDQINQFDNDDAEYNHDLGKDKDNDDNKNYKDDKDNKDGKDNKDDKDDKNDKDDKDKKDYKNDKDNKDNQEVKNHKDDKQNQEDKEDKDIFSQIWARFKYIITNTYEEAFNSHSIKEQKQVSLSQIGKIDKAKQLQIYENDKINMPTKHQISSELLYTQKLQSPIFPGGMSGITIGIGYDLGQCSIKQFQQNWKNKLAQDHYKMLEKCIGLKGEKAKMFLNQNKKDLSLIKIPIKTAKQVLNNKLQYYQKTIQKNYPKLKQIYPNTYNSLVCMHYNRGFSKKENQSRKQIILIDQVLSGKKQTNLPIPEFVAKQILSMCRLWQKDKNLKGLINRRHQQAENCMKDIKMKK